MTDEPGSEAGEAYRPKPPLWRPSRQDSPTHWSVYLAIGASCIAVGVMALGGEEHLFSTPPVRVTVEVKRIDGIHQDGEAPPVYRYAVELPNGAAVQYASEQIHRPGDRITLLWSRGRVTGRNLVVGPAVRVQGGGGARPDATP